MLASCHSPCRISDWPRVLHSSANGFDLLAQHFLQLFRVIGLQTRDRHHQTVIILFLQTINDNLLRGIVIVALDEALGHRHLQRHQRPRFTALVAPPFA